MKRYNTPHRSRVVKTRMTEEEYAEFAQRLSACNMSQAEFIRQAITRATIRPIVTVSPVNDELLAAVGKLTAVLSVFVSSSLECFVQTVPSVALTRIMLLQSSACQKSRL